MSLFRRLDRLTLLAVVLALVGGSAAYVSLRTPVAEGAGVEARRPLVVAVKPVAAGARITAGDLRVEQVPGSGAPRGAVARIEDAEGKFATLPIVANEPLLAAKLSDQPPGSSLAALVPPDRFAVSIAVNDVISTGGLLAPGDHVDVLGVASKEAGGAAQIVLRNVPVLAVAGTLLGADAQKLTAKGGSDNPRSLNATVTLAVTIEEAQRLVQMDEIGKLRLALRGRSPGGG